MRGTQRLPYIIYLQQPHAHDTLVWSARAGGKPRAVARLSVCEDDEQADRDDDASDDDSARKAALQAVRADVLHTDSVLASAC